MYICLGLAIAAVLTSTGGRHEKRGYIGEFGPQIEEGRVIMDGKLMSTVVWSLAIFRAFESPLYDGILRSVKQCDVRDFDPESVRRLYQVNILGCGVLRPIACQSLTKVQSGNCTSWKL